MIRSMIGSLGSGKSLAYDDAPVEIGYTEFRCSILHALMGNGWMKERAIKDGSARSLGHAVEFFGMCQALRSLRSAGYVQGKDGLEWRITRQGTDVLAEWMGRYRARPQR